MAKPAKFDWKRWTVDALLWDSNTPSSRYGRLLARKTERPKLAALGEIIETTQVDDRQAAVIAAHDFIDKFAHAARGTVSVEVHISGPEKAIEEEWQARLRRAEQRRRGRPAPATSDARVKPGNTSPS